MKSLDSSQAERIRARLEKPVVLIGLMGAGKTRTGKALAKILDLPFADSDEEIEKAAGMDIPAIFTRFGEPYFREGEQKIISRLMKKGPMVIATGGGAVMTPATADLVWDGAVSIWLRADMNIMLERVGRTDRRPLLKDRDAEEVLTDLAAKRYPVYEKADIVVESHNGPAEALLNQVLDKLDHFLTRHA